VDILKWIKVIEIKGLAVSQKKPTSRAQISLKKCLSVSYLEIFQHFAKGEIVDTSFVGGSWRNHEVLCSFSNNLYMGSKTFIGP